MKYLLDLAKKMFPKILDSDEKLDVKNDVKKGRLDEGFQNDRQRSKPFSSALYS